MMHVQIAAQRPRSQNPSPHSSSLVQRRFGTFLDQTRSGQSFTMLKSSGVRKLPGRCCTSLDSKGGLGAEAAGRLETGAAEDDALGGAIHVDGGALAMGSTGCSIRLPKGVSSLDEQEAPQTKTIATAVSSVKNISQRIWIVSRFMAICTPDFFRRALQ